MNSNFLTITLWLGSFAVQMVVFAIVASRQKGRDDAKISQIGELSDRILELETQMANIRGWLRGVFHDPLNGGQQ